MRATNDSPLLVIPAESKMTEGQSGNLPPIADINPFGDSLGMNRRKSTLKGQDLSLKAEVKSDLKAAQKLWMPWWLVLIWMAICLSVIVLFDSVGRLGMALPLLNCIAVFAFLIYLKRGLSRQVSFWVSLAILATLHALMIWYVPWTTKWVPAVAIATISSLDFCLMLWIVDVVARLDRRTVSHQTAR